jgi:hypothetical protein
MAPLGPAPDMVSKRLDDADLGELAPGRFLVEPVEEFCERDAVELVGFLHAADLGVVLPGLGREHRVALFDQHCIADAANRRDECDGCGARVDPDALVGGAELAQLTHQRRDIGDLGDAAEALLQVGGDLVLLDEQGRLALLRDEREAEHHREVWDVATAHVEEPVDRLGQGENDDVGILGGEGFPKFGELVLGGPAGAVVAEELDGADRRGRAITPDLVDEVGGRDEGHLAGKPFAQILDLARGVQPRVEAELTALGDEVPEARVEATRWGFHDGDGPGVGLERRLQGVAAIDEEAGLLEADDGDAGGAGKTRDISETRLALGHRLAAMGVGARDEEAVEAGVSDRPAQRFEPSGDGRRSRPGDEFLEDGGAEGGIRHGSSPVKPGCGIDMAAMPDAAYPWWREAPI